MGIFDVASEKKTASGQTIAILNYIKQGKMTVFAELLTQVIMIIVMVSWKQEPNQPHTGAAAATPFNPYNCVSLTILSTTYTMASPC